MSGRWLSAAGSIVALGLLSGTATFVVFTHSAGAERPSLAGTLGSQGSADPIQDEALADGVVTLAEYSAAIDVLSECGVAAGYSAHVIPGKGLRPPRASFSAKSVGQWSAARVKLANELMSTCSARFYHDVDAAWKAQRPAPTSAELGALYDWLEGCVKAGGVPGARAPTYWESGGYANEPRQIQVESKDLRVYSECALEAEAETGFLAPHPD